MTEKGLVSIIVPVYKADNLERCIQSLVFQTYSHIEIILVNDGSMNLWTKICEDWSQNDCRVKVIHNECGGLSSARNEGLKNACGEYIAFVNAGDWISLGMIEKMASVMGQYHADMVTCQFVNVYQDGTCRKNWDCSDDIRVCDAKEMIRLLLQEGEITNYVWARLYKRELLGMNLFPTGKEFGDVFVSYQLIMRCRRIVIMEEAFYYSFRNDAEITANISAKAVKDRHEAYGIREKVLMENYPELYDEIKASGLQDMLIINVPLFRQIKSFCSKAIGKWEHLCGRDMRMFYRNLYRGSEPCFYILAVPEYGNLGDQALLKAEEEFVEKYFPKYHLICIPLSKLGIYGRIYLKQHVKKKDILCLHAGGNIGTLYPGIHELQERLISVLHDRSMTIFPQTFYYGREAGMDKMLEKTKRVYKKCRDLQITVREEASFEFVRKQFCNKAYCFPDMALFLKPFRGESSRKGVLLCLRNDLEKTLSDRDYQYLLTTVHARFEEIEEADTYLAWDPPSKRQMQNELRKCLNKFRAAQIVITDRLHGMVFAALTETPCAVLLSKSHKVSGVYQWIKHLDYIRLVREPEELGHAIDAVCSIKTPICDMGKIMPYWDKLADIVER